MNIDPDGKHEIVRMTPRTEEEDARWLALTDEEAADLLTKSPAERRAWLRERMPTKERLARHLRWIGLPVLAAKAAQGEYSDFDENSPHATPKLVLVRDLDGALVKAKRRMGEHSDKAFRIEGLRKLVIAGEYDDTAAESDAWDARQTGEIRKMLDMLKDRPDAPTEAGS